jgi:two-component system OmpR family response regulator
MATIPLPPIPVRIEDVYVLTDRAEMELRGGQTSLSPSELELLVLVDGRSNAGQVASRARIQPKSAALAILAQLARDGLIAIAGGESANAADDNYGALDFGGFFNSKSSGQPGSKAVADADKEAATGLVSLQQTGFYVRFARRAATERELAEGEKISIIVIEDDPHLSKALGRLLAIEGFEPRIATNRDEILAELRRPPRPDLVLLDVTLPDADGFDILMKMRQHPALKTVPVVMLTAKETREAVLKGLAAGADGYITKPFEVDVLMKAIRTVLGLPEK